MPLRSFSPFRTVLPFIPALTPLFLSGLQGLCTIAVFSFYFAVLRRRRSCAESGPTPPALRVPGANVPLDHELCPFRLPEASMGTLVVAERNGQKDARADGGASLVDRFLDEPRNDLSLRSISSVSPCTHFYPRICLCLRNGRNYEIQRNVGAGYPQSGWRRTALRAGAPSAQDSKIKREQ
jgi:hypothetical protein